MEDVENAFAFFFGRHAFGLYGVFDKNCLYLATQDIPWFKSLRRKAGKLDNGKSPETRVGSKIRSEEDPTPFFFDRQVNL